MLDLLDDCRSKVDLDTPPTLLETNQVASPLLFGLLQPCLLLPEGMMKQLGLEQIRHIFMHELAHIKLRHIMVSWLATLLQILHWFNPLVWLAFYRMRSDRELACDAFALSRLRPTEVKPYAETIINLVERYSMPTRVPAIVGILDSKSQLTRRISMIANFRTGSHHWSALGIGLLIVLACVGLTDARDTPTAKSTADENTKVTLPPDSKIDERGRIVDKIDYPFVNDPQVIGKWKSVDFVDTIEKFNPKTRNWNGDLFLKELVFLVKGRISHAYSTGTKGVGNSTWTQGRVCHPRNQTAPKYHIKEMNGSPYMFYEWKSGDYKYGHRKPSYYVLKKTSSDGG